MGNLINGYAKVVFPHSNKEYVYLIPSYIEMDELFENMPEWVVVPNAFAEKGEAPYTFARLVDVSEAPYSTKVKPRTFIVSYINKKEIKEFNHKLSEKKTLLDMIDKCHALLDEIPEKFDNIKNQEDKAAILDIFEMYLKNIV